MQVSLKNITSLFDDHSIEYKVCGSNICVNQLAAISPEVKYSLCYYVGTDPNDLDGVEQSIIICARGLNYHLSALNTIIYTENPQLCFYLASVLFENKPKCEINERTVIDPDVQMGNNITIGPFCHIENCIIGNGVTIETGVKIHKGSIIGDRVHIQSNTVIGATGVMWTWDKNGKKITCAQTGNVIIEDDVFIGSNITIVKGAFCNKNTIIGKGSTIAHGTMIGHGSVIGPNNHFANNVSIAGSVISGKNCFFGSGVAIRPHVKLANDMIIGAGAVVVKNFDDISGLVIAGNPAKVLKRKREKYSGVPSNHSY